MNVSSPKPLWNINDLRRFVRRQLTEWPSSTWRQDYSVEIESLLGRFQAVLRDHPERLSQLHAYRIRGSSSLTIAESSNLLRQQENWICSNQWVLEQNLARLLMVSSFCYLNSLIVGASESARFRQQPVYLLGDLMLDHCEVHDGVSVLEQEVIPALLGATEPVDQIFVLSLFVQVFSMVHPFADGNGRTARLLADAYLAEKGFPPLSFLELSDSFVLVKDLSAFSMRSFLLHLQSLKWSLQIVGDTSADDGAL